jgi:hypothetical protein
MASNIRNTVEPTFGWLFVAVVIAVLAGVLLAATTPRSDFVDRVDTHGRIAR